ncbi:MAG: DNA-directed RNA polymerase sigma-70 factor [bacterium]|nr:MAG: DNA-directed RNA polymerase sigma-70 factor [bacterium]
MLSDHFGSSKSKILTDEKTLVKALKNGDKVAFEKIFQIYHKQLYLFCYSFLNQKEDAENLTQDVFVKLWVKRAAIDCEKSFSGFLFTMTKNLALNYIRKTIYQQIYVNQMLNNSLEDRCQTDKQISYNEIKSRLNDLINQLPLKRKEIFLLSREHGLSQKEIAEQMGVSIHTVESQISKALKFIRKGLKGFTLLFFLLINLI